LAERRSRMSHHPPKCRYGVRRARHPARYVRLLRRRHRHLDVAPASGRRARAPSSGRARRGAPAAMPRCRAVAKFRLPLHHAADCR
jgi:hypothetical protein